MKRRIEVLFCTLLALQALSPAPLRAEDDAAAPPQIEPQAKAVLDGMTAILSGADKFRVEMLVGYEVLQENGQKIEFGETRELSVSRPDKLRIDGVMSDGTTAVTLFDGKQITLYDGAVNVYATAPQKADLDGSVVHYVRDLGMRLPLAPLVMKRLPEELARRVESLAYVEKTGILGETTHHIAGRTPTVDFEMWITDGKKPTLRKLALSYREAEGHPRFWAEFSDWDLDPSLRSSVFRFDPPSGARAIRFAADLVGSVAPAAAEGAAR